MGDIEKDFEIDAGPVLAARRNSARDSDRVAVFFFGMRFLRQRFPNGGRVMGDIEKDFEIALRIAREVYELLQIGLSRKEALERLLDNETKMLAAFAEQEERLKR